jgi:predicted dehydrogenase
MAHQRLKIGMIGAGLMGQIAHLMNYVEIEDCEVVALAELRPNLRKRVASKYQIPRTYETHRQLLEDPEVQAVIVVTPRPYIYSVALDCLSANKHVLTEKPMACTLEQAENLVAAAKKNHVRYVIGYMKRYDEGVQIAKQMLDEYITTKELGDIIFARVTCFMGDFFAPASGHVVTGEQAIYPDHKIEMAPPWIPKNHEMDFAGYLNTYSHDTNLLRYLFDRSPEVEHVNFTSMKGRLAALHFGSFVASLETGRSQYHYWHEQVQIFFEGGHLLIKVPSHLLRNVSASVDVYTSGNRPMVLSPKTRWTWAFKRQAEAFVDCILREVDSLNPGEDAIEDLRLIEKMWKMQIEKNPTKVFA